MGSSSERWGSRVGLVLAMAGNAVGLGNFLRFPAQAVANGGGAFIIPYLVSFLMMGIPLLWIEWGLGRYGGQHGHHSTPGMLDVVGRSRFWKYVGTFGIFTNLTVIAYYTYIESWTLGYVWHTIAGTFQNASSTEISHYFDQYLGIRNGGVVNVSRQALFFFVVTLGLNLWILSRGLMRGVEIASKIGMPILLGFSVFLAFRILTINEGELGAVNDAIAGLNFLWEPQFDSLTNPKVWMAAAGQVFFTLSVGMGSIQCYASYLREKEDIALSASSAGWMNEFIEVILGGSIIVPVAVAYLGLDWVIANVGFEMGFRTMPTLFQHWGPWFAAAGGIAWFGLLFFAGITSSLAMGQPVVAFLQDEFSLSRERSTLVLGIAVALLAAPCILFYELGAFDEFDFWGGTFSLVLFALLESIAFMWVFGRGRAWEEITRGAEIRIPRIFSFIATYITPLFLIVIFLGALVKPIGSEWTSAFESLFAGDGWPLSHDSVLGRLMNVGLVDASAGSSASREILVRSGTRLLLTLTFAAIAGAIFVAWRNRRKEKSA